MLRLNRAKLSFYTARAQTWSVAVVCHHVVLTAVLRPLCNLAAALPTPALPIY